MQSPHAADSDSAASFYTQLVRLSTQVEPDVEVKLQGEQQDLLHQADALAGQVGNAHSQQLQQHSTQVDHAGAAAAAGYVPFKPVRFAQPVTLDPNSSMMTLPPKAATVVDAIGQGRSQGHSSRTAQHSGASAQAEFGSQTSRSGLRTQTETYPAASAATGAGSKRPIERSNIGFQLLQKAGWQEGKGVGAQEQGMATPLQATFNKGNSGLGFQHHKQQRQQGLVQTNTRRGEQQEQPTAVAGPVLGSKRVAALVAADLAAEDTDTKVKRHRQVMQQEAKDKRDKAIQQYLYRAFNEPSDYGGADNIPLANSHRLSATNPLLD